MKYLLDTNVFREVGKTLPHPNVSAWLKTVDDADLAVSALTVREVTKGIVRLRALKPDVAAAIEARVATVFVAFSGRILAVDNPVAASRRRCARIASYW
jgi:predicted nucleic acid-binding protein